MAGKIPAKAYASVGGLEDRDAVSLAVAYEAPDADRLLKEYERVVKPERLREWRRELRLSLNRVTPQGWTWHWVRLYDKIMQSDGSTKTSNRVGLLLLRDSELVEYKIQEAS